MLKLFFFFLADQQKIIQSYFGNCSKFQSLDLWVLDYELEISHFKMPPWHLEKYDGHLKNLYRLNNRLINQKIAQRLINN